MKVLKVKKVEKLVFRYCTPFRLIVGQEAKTLFLEMFLQLSG